MLTDVSGLTVTDYCQQDCQTQAERTPDAGWPVTPWIGERCGCCGGEWGGDGTGACRGVHLIGWGLILDAYESERLSLAATPPGEPASPLPDPKGQEPA